MSSVAQGWVWKNSKSRGSMRMVLLRIADQMSHHGGDSWPGVKTIAEDCNISTRQVQKCIGGLVDLGELLVFQNAGGSKGCPADRRPNRYDMPKIDGWLPPQWLTPKSDPFGYMKAVFELEPAETDGVNSTTPREVNPTTPRNETGCRPGRNGVNSRVQRGELQGSNGVNPTTPDMPLDIPREKSRSAREAPEPASSPDFSEWKPAATTIQRIKKLHPAGDAGPGITEEFLEDILPEFLTYAESNHLERHELEYKFMSNATRQFLRPKKGRAFSGPPKDAVEVSNWVLKNGAPKAWIGESLPDYRQRLRKWDQSGRPPADPQSQSVVMDLPGNLDGEVEEELKRLHG